MDFHSIFSILLNLAFIIAAAFYAGVVLISYLTYGPRLRPRLDWHDPAHSVEQLAIWLGVKVLTLIVRATSRLLEMLSEASAEVGDWFLSHRHPEAH